MEEGRRVPHLKHQTPGVLPNTQSSLTVDNNFITLDLSNSFNTSSPPIKGLAFPNGPAVASGALWASTDGNYLYQFGGEFSDTPPVSPTTQLMWRYNITAGSWLSIPTGGDQVMRPAEGATCVVPGQGTNGNGLGVYLGGHLDAFTVPGWSVEIAREYLQSMVIFDMVLTPSTSGLFNFRVPIHSKTIRDLHFPPLPEQTAQSYTSPVSAPTTAES
jgi:hypothetical protein